jgi:WXXGXW repeat (2 copies)
MTTALDQISKSPITNTGVLEGLPEAVTILKQRIKGRTRVWEKVPKPSELRAAMLNFSRIRYLLFACLLGLAPSLSSAFISITIAPPVLPVYDQPPCPEDGYLWVPGYWAYEDNDYYWVPGVWVEPPEARYLWTPGYWAFADGGYNWHGGYWGPHVGYYGGINYGYGYQGSGFYGGRWQGNSFHYNTAVWQVNNTVVHNTYVDRTVVNNGSATRASFNGPGGIAVRPTAAQEAARQERHAEATSAQREHEQAALHDPNQHFAANHGHPATPAQSSVAGHQKEAPGGNQVSSPHHPEPASQATTLQRHGPATQANSPQHKEPAAQISSPEHRGHATQAGSTEHKGQGPTVQSSAHQNPVHEKRAAPTNQVARTSHPASHPEHQSHPTSAARPAEHHQQPSHAAKPHAPAPKASKGESKGKPEKKG